jgi:hypothetical protein
VGEVGTTPVSEDSTFFSAILTECPSGRRVVYFDSPRGRFGHVTAGATLYEAAANALDWFTDAHWPHPADHLSHGVLLRPGGFGCAKLD